MELNVITETKAVATEKWKEYRDGLKKKNDPAYRDLKQLYWQLSHGKKLVDIFDVIKNGGVHEKYHPKLAVTKATAKTVECRYETDGSVEFRNDAQWARKKEMVILKKCLPVIPDTVMPDRWRTLTLSAPVPIIPPSVLPAKLTDDYYILWEVDEWKMVPPTDPWLLKRINERMFVAVAGWNLTALEKSVMASKIK